MVEVAEELIEPVHGRQRFVAIADVVLAELPCGVAEVLHQAADGGIQLAHAHRRAGVAHLGESGADAMLAGQERRAACGARLLPVVVEELDAFAADAVDVRCRVAHQAVRIGADVRDADVVTEDDEDVGPAGPLAGSGCAAGPARPRETGCRRADATIRELPLNSRSRPFISHRWVATCRCEDFPRE